MVDLLWLEVAFNGESTSLYTPLPDSGIVGPSVLEIVKDLPGRPPEDQNWIHIEGHLCLFQTDPKGVCDVLNNQLHPTDLIKKTRLFERDVLFRDAVELRIQELDYYI